MESILPWIILGLIIYTIAKRFFPVKGIAMISPQEAKKRAHEKDVQWIDVRTPNEYRSNAARPFKNVPLSQLANRSNEWDRKKEVVLICQSGMRSMKAAKILKKQGFTKITNVKGGMGAWT